MSTARRAVRTVRSGLLAGIRGLGLAVMSLAVSLGLFVLAAVSIALIAAGAGAFLVPPVMTVVRRYAGLRRRVAGRWSRVEIAEPYRAMPVLQGGVVSVLQRTQWIVTDRATWRDMTWLLLDATAGFVLAMAAFAVTPSVAGILVSPWVIRLHGRMAGTLLAPTRARALELRVQRLAETRSDAVSASATELRRIERDLHDGAQARLVAMGMSLGAAERLVDRDPARAKLLLAEARTASADALAELRDLVHGIHPPVLAERGLGDALRALALDTPLRTEVSLDLPGPLETPVEAAAYFAVSELLANAAKHSGARQVGVDVGHDGAVLRIRVTDDGRGGADPARGTGLRGIERRLGTFDGLLAVHSPPGGPTTITMDLPCAALPGGH